VQVITLTVSTPSSLVGYVSLPTPAAEAHSPAAEARISNDLEACLGAAPLASLPFLTVSALILSLLASHSPDCLAASLPVHATHALMQQR
jgi:hypothetical protein